jgi:type I restriction enzyme M protein
MAKARRNQNRVNGANLWFEPTMWAAADKLRGNMDAAEYRHVVLGLIFLKYISDAIAKPGFYLIGNSAARNTETPR